VTDRPLRIAHVYNWLDPAIGGPPRVIVGIAAGQQRMGHEVRLISSDLAGAPPVEALLAEHLSPIPPRTTVRPKFFRPIVNRGRLRRALRDVDVAHLHGIWPPVSLLAAQTCRALGIPYVLAPHGSLHGSALGERPLRKIVGMWVLGYGEMVRRAAAIHALNDEERQGASWVRLPERVEVIPNGVFPEDFEGRPPAGAFRTSIPALDDAPYILFLSRLHPGKGLDLLGEAFVRVARARPDVHLVVAGDDHGARADLEACAARHGLAARVHLVGRLEGERKAAAFCEAAVYCLPSRHEGFSIAITEALAWGRPVVITATCHFPQVAEEGCGVVTALDAEEIAAGLLRVLDDPEAGAMGARGRALVTRRYTWPAIAERTVALYREILGDR
jgi:glycosyltransferase involved in cell wall biosynthesis